MQQPKTYKAVTWVRGRFPPPHDDYQFRHFGSPVITKADNDQNTCVRFEDDDSVWMELVFHKPEDAKLYGSYIPDDATCFETKGNQVVRLRFDSKSEPGFWVEIHLA